MGGCRLLTVNVRGADPALVSDALRLLPAERRDALTLLRPHDRLLGTVGEAAIRTELSKRYGASCAGLPLVRNGRGKPYFAEREDFCFNLSHAGECVVCAFSDAPVGVDAEALVPRNFRSIAARLYSPRERREIENAPSPLARAYQFWTLRESVLKRLGLGIADLKRLSFGKEPPAAFLDGAELPVALFSFWLRLGEADFCAEGDADYSVALCCGTDLPPQKHFCGANELLRAFLAIDHQGDADFALRASPHA